VSGEADLPQARPKTGGCGLAATELRVDVQLAVNTDSVDARSPGIEDVVALIEVPDPVLVALDDGAVVRANSLLKVEIALLDTETPGTGRPDQGVVIDGRRIGGCVIPSPTIDLVPGGDPVLQLRRGAGVASATGEEDDNGDGQYDAGHRDSSCPSLSAVA